MTSWRLLYCFFPDNTALKRGPVFAHEMRQQPLWGPLAQWSSRLPVPLIVGILLIYFLADFPTLLLVRGMVFFVALRVCMLMPSMLYLVIPLALTLSPVIVREREQVTWEMLRAIPLSTGQIIQEKAAGALWWMRFRLNDMVSTTLLTAVVVGGIGLVAGGSGLSVDQGYVLYIGVVAVITVGSVVAFLLDRVQQLGLMIVVVLAASATRRSLRDALPLAVTAVSGVWMLDVGLAWLILLVLPGPLTFPTEIHAIIFVLFSPIIVYLIELPLGLMVLVVMLTLALREIIVRALWRWTVNEASIF